MFKLLYLLLGITLYCAQVSANSMFQFDRVASMMQDPTLNDEDGNLIEYDDELKFLAQELKDVKQSKSKGALKKYKSKYDIPESVQNYTDARNVTHPIWAKPFFDREYHTFNEIWKTKNGTSEEIYQKFKP